MIYLDNAATTYPKPEEVYKKMDWVNRYLAVNAGRGSYGLARTAMRLIDDTKEKLIELVGGKGYYTVSLLPSITVALNQIIQGLDYNKCRTIYISAYEHNAVARPLHLIAQNNKNVTINFLPMKPDLTIDLEKTRYLFSQTKPDVVVLNMISNVTGYVLPFEEIFNEAKKYDCLTILDSAQGLGIIEFNIMKACCDILAFTSHKALYGPIGIGGMIIKNDVHLNSFIVGGNGMNSLELDISNNNEFRYEFSSPNIVSIGGLNEALCQLDIGGTKKQETELTDYLLTKLKSINKVHVISYPAYCQIGVVSFTVEGYDSEDIGMILDDDYGISVRTGYHCAPYIHEHLQDKKTNGTIRISVGKYNCKKDIDMLFLALEEIGG